MKINSTSIKSMLFVFWIIQMGFSYTAVYGQPDFPQSFAKISKTGSTIPLDYDLTFDQSGGHIQGIQVYRHQSKEQILLSGSSTGVAFMAVAEAGATIEVTRIDTLNTAPYRHAGGFQVMDHYLAVGIEDNHLRTSSQVVIYDLQQSGHSGFHPIHIIDRQGKYERVTAGAVGIAGTDQHILVVVANWDARHLDWYRCPVEEFEKGNGTFQLLGSLAMAEEDRTNWSDTAWYSYQNINLVSEPGGSLYMVGFATSESGQDVADLYQVWIGAERTDSGSENIPMTDPHPIEIVKINSRTFDPAEHTSFGHGAGLYQNSDGTWMIYACPEHLNDQSVIGMYKP